MNNAASIRRVAVLGAGVMGAQIAAHLANADVPVVLFDLPAKDGDPNGIATKAIANLAKLNPAPLAVKERAALIQPANYDQHLEELRSCDLLIEAIAERSDWKASLYERVTPYVGDRAILATNTSGLPLGLLAESVPEGLRPRFCGIHFFNPPRYMALVELIPCPSTDPAILDLLETFLVSTFWSAPWARAWSGPRTPPILSPTASACFRWRWPYITPPRSSWDWIWWTR